MTRNNVTRPDRWFDWRRLATSDPTPPSVDSSQRLRTACLAFGALLLIVVARVVALEWSYGDAQRAEATRPRRSEIVEPALRGRILAADGAVLAYDEARPALAVHYRSFEQPVNAAWLRRQARGRLTRAQLREPGRLAAEQERVLAERATLHAELAALCGLSLTELIDRMAAHQARVERIAHGVNERQAAHHQAVTNVPDDASPWQRFLRRAADLLTADDSAPEPTSITVAEELEYHTLHEGLSLAAVAEIEGNPARYPGVRIVSLARRTYPAGMLAAHVLGHVGATLDSHDARTLVGRMGLERQYEDLLRGRPGMTVELADRSGRVVDRRQERAAEPGQDLRLALDPALQRTAESLLDEALTRKHSTAGGAIVALDVHSGAILCAASAPRFRPEVLDGSAPTAAAALLTDERKPLFDRVTKMALPPGSVFKVVTAAALLESRTVGPHEPFACQGYLHSPDRLRCMLYRHQGIGHGETTLGDALAWSCNTYFFHHAERLGDAPLIEWARRLGFGVRTGVDAPDEVAGTLPTAAVKPQTAREQAHALAIGQGTLTATPLQIARLMATVANGGRLVTPRFVRHIGLIESSDEQESAAINEPAQAVLDASTLTALRRGLERVVADEQGTAHRTVYDEHLAIAGKTGTAEMGSGRADTAWFAGYVPAERPRVAIVVVLEQAGSGGEAAGPLARRLALKLERLGLLGRLRLAREAARP